MRPVTLNVTLTPKQMFALMLLEEGRANEVLMGGGALSGKSFLSRVVAIKTCLDVPGVQVYVFRRTYKELWDTHMEGPGSFPELLVELVDSGYCEIVRAEIRFANGSRIALSHCHEESDKFKLQGAELNAAIFDELTHFTESIYTYLRTRVRLGSLAVPEKRKGTLPFILATSNPGGVGHSFVRSGWVKNGAFRIVQMPPEQGGMRRCFVHATLDDLVFMPAPEREAYRAKLLGSGGDWARALIEGDWDCVSNSCFGSVWSRAKHVVRTRPLHVSMVDSLFRSCDDGFQAPAACLWWAYDSVNCRWFIIRELFEAGLLPEQMAKKILDIDRSIQIQKMGGDIHDLGHPLSGIIDSSSFRDEGTGAMPRGNRMNQLNCRWKPVEKDPGSRVWGIQRIYEMLSTLQKDGLPQLQIYDCCPNLIEAIGTCPRDPKKPEDADPNFPLDHLVDACRYGIRDKKKPSFKHVRWGGM